MESLLNTSDRSLAVVFVIAFAAGVAGYSAEAIVTDDGMVEACGR